MHYTQVTTLFDRNLHIVSCEANYRASLQWIAGRPVHGLAGLLRLHIHHAPAKPLADRTKPLTASAQRVSKQIVPGRALFLCTLNGAHSVILLCAHRALDFFLFARANVQAALVERVLAHEMHSRQVQRHAAVGAPGGAHWKRSRRAHVRQLRTGIASRGPW
jgi:hypothetical protein